MSGEKRSVELPEALCSEMEKQFGPRMGSLEEILTHVMRELTQDESSRMDDAERKMLEKRLRDLGYL